MVEAGGSGKSGYARAASECQMRTDRRLRRRRCESTTSFGRRGGMQVTRLSGESVSGWPGRMAGLTTSQVVLCQCVGPGRVVDHARCSSKGPC